MSQFKHGLCGCFDDCGLCVITYFVPCYTFGKNAEILGESCIMCGLGFMFFPLCLGTYLRGKVRERSGIPGSVVSDFFMWWCCGFCALVQEAQELKDSPGAQALERE